MSTAQLATRLYAIVTGTPVRDLERGEGFSPDAANRTMEAIGKLRDETGCGFFTNREPPVDLDSILHVMDHFRKSHGVRLFFIDYLQLIGLGDEDQMHREITKISRAVRGFCRERNVTVLALSQYNRSTSANRDVSPIPQSLIGSSSLENDSDQTVLLDHSRFQRSPAGSEAKTWLILGKNRHGSTGEIPIAWDYRTLRAREAMQDEEREWPKHPRRGAGGGP